ncbi:MAG: chitobiase/beta-hexosaminidase C-terminal domain-containing protein [Muribaculaceae bacterium]|nr:chitobiase/beta-hexosaminidase C-terminal domain-containing protein [Muribaculaceae bacterium]
MTWTPGSTDNFTYFAFYQNGKAASGTNKLAASDAIVVTYETSGGGSSVTAPTFKIGGETFTNGTKFANPVSLTITGDSGNSFYYTYGSTTPSDPDTNSTAYTGAISITSDGTYYYKAIASDGTNNSLVTSANFIVATQYGITCASGLTGGTVSTDVANAFAGDEVTVTATPSTGYALDAITVTGATSGDPVTVTNGKFTMPAEAVNVTATFSVSNTIFEETWSGTSGTGGNDGNWSGSIASATLTADNSGWTVENAGGASACAKFGTSSKKGVATTPDIAVANNTVYKLTFKAAAWGTNDATNLPISATGGSLYLEEACTNSVSSVTMANSAWTTYTVYVKTSSTTLNITWQGNAASNSRFFLDEVKFETVAAKAYTISVASGITNGTVEVSPTSSDGNENITVTATPDTGYELASLTFNNGTAVTTGWTTTNGVSTYTYALTTGDLEVGATFTKVQYSITNQAKLNGVADSNWTGGSHANFTGVSTVGNVWGAKYGDVVTFNANTNNGYQILQENISIKDANDNDVSFTFGSGNLVTFTMPASNVTITSNFTNYRPTIKLAGRYNTTSTSDWVNTNVGPQFTYNSGTDTYTLDVFFATESSNFFYLFVDGTATWPTSSGNWSVQNTSGTATALTWNGSDGNEFAIAPGIYTITIAGDKSTIAFTKHDPTLTFSPASGSSVETGSTVSVSSTLSSLIAAIDANATVTVGVNDDNGSTWNASYEFVNADEGSKTLYGKAYIGNIAVTGTATYTVSKATNSNKFQRITSTSDLEIGKKYIIVYETDPIAIPNTTNSNTAVKLGASITLDGNTTTLPIGHGVGIFTLGAGYTFKYTNATGSGDLYLTLTADNNGLRATSESQNWSITFDGNNAVIVANDGTDDRFIREYDATGGHDFRTYKTSTTNGNPVQLYKEVAAGDYTIDYATVTGGSLSGPADANEGDVITVTATGDTGYACTSISVSPSAAVTDNGDGTYTFTMPASNVTVTPTWAESIAITYVNTYLDNNGENPTTGTAGGTATGPASAVEGARVNVTVTPDDAYQLQSLTYEWASGSRDITANKYFDMPATPTTVTAVFEKKPFSLTVVSANGQVTGVPATAVSGQAISFTVTPIAGYTITNVFYEYQNNDATVQTAITPTEGVYSFNMPAKDVTIRVGYFAGDEYELLTDVNDITAGDTYLIVGGAAASAPTPTSVMGTTISSSYLNAITLTSETYATSSETPPGIISSSSSMAIVDFVAGTGDDAGKWAIHTADGYLYNSSGTTLTIGTTPSYASIALGDNSRATITYGSNVFSFNNSSPRFKLYSGSQGATYIYKLHDSNKVKKPSITGAAGQHIGLYNFIGTDEVTLACATTGATIEYSLDGGTTWVEYDEPFALPQTALGGTVEVKARATKDGMDDSDMVTATFTCIKPEWHTKPCGDNWATGDTIYNNPVFIYPICSLADRNAYGRANCRFFYTLDGTTPTMASAEVATPTSGDKFIFLDSDVELTIIPVINDIAGDPITGEIYFEPAAATPSLAGGSYDGDQQTRLSTTTKSSHNGTSWTTQIWYTLDSSAPAFAFGSDGTVTSTGWTLYDPTNAPYIDILVENGDVQTLRSVTLTNFYGGTFTGAYSGASVNLNSTGTWVAGATTSTTYTLTAANLDVVFSPAGGTYLYSKDVTLTPQNSIGAVTILYSLTWASPDATHVNVSGGTYTGPITIDQDATLYVLAEDSRTGSEGKTYEKTHEYKIGVQEPLYSPYPGDYMNGSTYLYGDHFTGDNEGDVSVEIFDVSPNAKIYYTYTETLTDDATYDGTQPYPEPAAPTRTTGKLYSAPIDLKPGYTYVFSAIAYVGDLESTVRMRAFTVRTFAERGMTGNYWANIKEMNEETSTSTTKKLANPVEVIWMSTWRNNGEKPEFCFIRDNSGYGLVYFGGSSVTEYNSYTKFQSGDWLPGNSIGGKVAVWSNSYINELGSSSGSVEYWPTTAMATRPIVPETTNCKAIRDGWTYEGSYSGTDYKSYVDPDPEKNLFGHYVHLRKNTITNVVRTGNNLTTANPGKLSGIITGELGTPLQYYDGMYRFSGYGSTTSYDQTFFDQIQNAGGTFDVYAIPYFYGGNTTSSTYSYAPYEVFPIAFDWIFPPIFHLEGDATASDMTNDTPERTIHAASTVTLSCDTRGAIIWYKTSDMEDYEVYEGQEIAVSKSMEISTYSIHSTQFFDQLESKVRTLTINMGDIEQPEISPESQVNPEGSEAVTVSITCATEDATIWYTLDGSDPDDEANEARVEYTAPFEVSQTTTVRAIASAMDGDEVFYGMEAEQKTYTFVKSNGIVYDLVTSASQLKEGSIYVIVSKANHMAMQRTQKADNRDGAGVAFVDDETKAQVYGNDDLAMFTLHQYGSTGDWILHTANGSDNASIGYIYGNVSGTTNQLRTQFSNSSNEGKFEASIVIGGADSDVDKAYTATISFPAANGGERWLRYNKQYGLFNTYSSTTGESVFLYKKDAFPLANIEVNGKLNTDYTIADELIGVHAVGDKLYAKDQGNVSIIKTENTGGWIDYVAELEGRTEEWDQSNWVCLDFSDYGEVDGATYAGSFEGHLIPPATLTGTFTSDLNYTLLVKNAPSITPGAAETYTPNVLNPANFNTAYLNQGEAGVEGAHGRKFWFVNPKVQEVVEIHNAVWDGDKFVVPAKQDANGNTSGDDRYYSINGNGFEGGFTVDLSMNTGATSTSNLTEGNTSNFLAIVTRTDWNYGRERAAVNLSASPAPRRIAPGSGTASSSITVMPLNLGTGTPTEVKDLPDTVKEVKAVRYIDVVGRVSEQPFEGVNIVVTEYTDGTTSTRKVLK